jgi:hypothetical protein
MKRTAATTGIIGGLAGLLALAIPASPAAAQAHPAAQPRSPAQPRPAASVSWRLSAVSAVPHTTQAWAAGTEGFLGGPAVVLHLRAGKWKLVKSGLSQHASLTGIAAPATTRVWAAGYVPGGTTVKPLLARSSGGKFRPVTPHGLGSGELTSVTAASAADAWAAGFTGNLESATAKIRPLALHWNGHKWQRESVLGGKSGYQVTAISVSSASNAWLVAATLSGTRTRLLHWNGRKWSMSSFIPPAGLTFSAIATDAASRAWIAGTVITGGGSNFDGYAARWNGSSWKATPVPQSHQFSELLGVTMSGRDAWAVGEKLAGTTTSRIDPQILRWNGHAWKAQHAPNPAGQPSDSQSGLSAVSAGWSTFAVAVGYYYPDGGSCGPTAGEAAVYRDGSWHEAKLPAPKSGPAERTRPACGG